MTDILLLHWTQTNISMQARHITVSVTPVEVLSPDTTHQSTAIHLGRGSDLWVSMISANARL